MKAALKSTWENPNWNMKFLGDKKFGVKKTVDGKEWTWRGDFVADENKNTITLTCKGSTQPDEKKAKKIKESRPVFVFTFDADFKNLSGKINEESVVLSVKELKGGDDDDLGF